MLIVDRVLDPAVGENVIGSPGQVPDLHRA